MTKISVYNDGLRLVILLDDLPHLFIPDTCDWVGLSSYHYARKRFYIVFHMKTTVIRLDYDNEELWKEILQRLNLEIEQ